MIQVRRLATLDETDRRAVEALCVLAQATDGHRPLSDQNWLELTGTPSAEARLVLDRDAEHLVGSAHLTWVGRHWQLELVVHPHHRHAGVERALLEAALGDVGDHGGGEVVWWVFDPDDLIAQVARRLGFEPQRELLQMRCPLPLTEEPTWPDDVTVRSFRPGDEAAWLAANNRAFADHPEQGSWTAENLAARMAEDWFDPEGFLLAEDADGIAGFCWTKVHPEDGMGEIYVIGVDPSRRGSGLGRALVVAGLGSLASRGVTTGMLFVDAANEAAVRLYESLGFATVRVDRAYRLVVDPREEAS